MAFEEASVSISVDSQYLEAKMALFPAEDGSGHVSEAQVKKALNDNSVFTNIDWDLIREHLKSGQPVTNIVVARGEPQEDGVNGSIDYKFPCVSEFKPKLDEETGVVDFKELGRIKNIQKGEIIAEITYATQGKSGKDLRGNVIAPYPGKDPKLIIGTGTVLSADKSKLYAAVDGNIRWDKDKFVIDEVVNIRGDVDVSTGNIDFLGDVKISGGVAEGFTVKGRNVSVAQNVTNATVIATGDVEIRAGAIFSTVEAGNDIKINFAENATLSAGNDIYAKSLVSCRSFAKGGIAVSGGKGIIVGGETICYGNVSVAQLGSESYTKTVVNLGDTVNFMKQHNEKKEAFAKQKENFEKMAKLLEQLSALKKIQPLTEEQQKINTQAARYTISEKPKIVAKQAEIDKEAIMIERFKTLKVYVKSKIFPGVTIKIFTSVYDVSTETGNCTYIRSEDSGEVEFKVGTNW